jgi:hypothetical protein
MFISAFASIQVIQESVQVIIDGVTSSPRAIKVDAVTISVLCGTLIPCHIQMLFQLTTHSLVSTYSYKHIVTIGVKFLLYFFCTWVGATNGELITCDRGCLSLLSLT